MPGSEQEMALWASSAWLLGMDNLSFLKAAESDLPCQMATGGGFAARRHYTDDEQALYDVSRPALRRRGIEIEWLGHSSRGNLVRISRRRVYKA